jgi:hypothetical protein
VGAIKVDPVHPCCGCALILTEFVSALMLEVSAGDRTTKVTRIPISLALDLLSCAIISDLANALLPNSGNLPNCYFTEV